MTKSLDICEACGETFENKRHKEARFCSVQCFQEWRRIQYQRRLEAGEIKRSTFIVTTKSGDKYRAFRGPDGKRVLEHRQVFEEHWGVKLASWHRMKWLDGDTLNNDPANLVLQNDYAMERIRAGFKNISAIGRTICKCGGPRDGKVQTSTGKTIYYCTRCNTARIRKRRAGQAGS